MLEEIENLHRQKAKTKRHTKESTATKELPAIQQGLTTLNDDRDVFIEKDLPNPMIQDVVFNDTSEINKSNSEAS
jgi:hypothetical protein